jgi:hypothetical protein
LTTPPEVRASRDGPSPTATCSAWRSSTAGSLERNEAYSPDTRTIEASEVGAIDRGHGDLDDPLERAVDDLGGEQRRQSLTPRVCAVRPTAHVLRRTHAPHTLRGLPQPAVRRADVLFATRRVGQTPVTCRPAARMDAPPRGGLDIDASSTLISGPSSSISHRSTRSAVSLISATSRRSARRAPAAADATSAQGWPSLASARGHRTVRREPFGVPGCSAPGRVPTASSTAHRARSGIQPAVAYRASSGTAELTRTVTLPAAAGAHGHATGSGGSGRGSRGRVTGQLRHRPGDLLAQVTRQVPQRCDRRR